MKKIIFSLFIITGLIAFSCQDNNELISPDKILLQTSQEISNPVMPSSFSQENDSIVALTLMPFARQFTLNVKSENGAELLEVIKTAINDDKPVIIRVFKNLPTRVALVRELTSQEMAEYGERTLPSSDDVPHTKETLPIIPSETALNSLFNALKSANIPFNYAVDGCFARAHKMRQIIIQHGWDSGKFFVYGHGGAARLAAKSANPSDPCCVRWTYHVAPLVRVQTASGVQLRVLDPSLFNGPVTQQQWLAACTNTSCYSSASASSSRLVPGNVYYIAEGSNSPIYDNNYSSTNCVIAALSGYSGCSISPPAAFYNCP